MRFFKITKTNDGLFDYWNISVIDQNKNVIDLKINNTEWKAITKRSNINKKLNLWQKIKIAIKVIIL